MNFKKTTRSVSCISFTGATINTSVEILTILFGKPSVERNSGREETNYEWHLENENGTIFTIYDWRSDYALDFTESVEWHIGSDGSYTSMQAKEAIENMVHESFAYVCEKREEDYQKYQELKQIFETN